MATTITPADLTITISESWTAAGSDRGSTHTQTISNVTEFTNRIANVGTSEVDILGFDASNGQGSYIRTDVAYIRITNLDDTNYVTLGASDTGGDTFFVKLEAGQSFIINNDELEANTAGSASSAFSEADNISAKANGAAVDLEISVALT